MDLISVRGIEYDLSSVVGMKLIWLCGWSKMTSFQFGRSALIWFLCSSRKRLVFSVRIEIY